MEDPNFTIRSYLNFVNLLIKMNDIESANLNFEKATKIYKENEKDILFGTKTNYHISNYLLLDKKEMYKEAKEELLKLKEELIKEEKKGFEKISEMLAEINIKLGEFDEALQDQKRFNKFYIESRNKKENTLALFLSESYKEKELILNKKRLSRSNHEKGKELIDINNNLVDTNNALFISVVIIIALLVFVFVIYYYYKETKKISERSDLVDCFNRRFCVEKINQLIKNNKNISLTLLDIDHFKQINDLYGHETGDKVLIEITELIKNKLNKNSFLCRVGGEEFLIIEKFDVNKKIDIENIRSEIEKHIFDNNKKITSSFGNSIIQKNNKIKTFDKIYHELDGKLYKAKDNRRNNVVY